MGTKCEKSQKTTRILIPSEGIRPGVLGHTTGLLGTVKKNATEKRN